MAQPFHRRWRGLTSGKVEEIDLMMTVMRAGDSAKLIVSNGMIWKALIRNETI